jgi:hypothetical protein
MISNSLLVILDPRHSRLLKACSVIRVHYLPPGNTGVGQRHPADIRFDICTDDMSCIMFHIIDHGPLAVVIQATTTIFHSRSVIGNWSIGIVRKQS